MANEGFFESCYDVVRQVPEGRVTTYGQVAALLGNPRRARFVGFAMHSSPGMAAGVPCHRVVFKDGSLAPGFAFGWLGETGQVSPPFLTSLLHPPKRMKKRNSQSSSLLTLVKIWPARLL